MVVPAAKAFTRLPYVSSTIPLRRSSVSRLASSTLSTPPPIPLDEADGGDDAHLRVSDQHETSAKTATASTADDDEAQPSYLASVWEYMQTMSPLLLRANASALQEAQRMARDESSDKGARRRAQLVVSANCHSQTGLPLPLLFRLCTFVPVNIPTVAGMVLSPPTRFNTIFWQWVNQTYNALFNFCNANKSSRPAVAVVILGYLAAVTSAVSIALYFRIVFARVLPLPPIIRGALVPFISVASANIANVLLMRVTELLKGIAVTTEDGVVLGRSKRAARRALLQVCISRVMLPLPVVVVPTVFRVLFRFLPAALRTQQFFPFVYEMASCIAALWAALPFALALFPEKGRMSVASLESELQAAYANERGRGGGGSGSGSVVYDKGL
ncbi:unnamed protein product [Vitrella brassicaformis CCMP3155]|uniref:Sidoreflexin n=2 Tax=Vitrella brassicaformis TaxID=1169539 RepID=A0A0G4ED41_VITBC|nr:unnamed protein product [Vitrella brassicaformis CCMP3155]|eukprot:CEL93476.1 unnamed protein product [Vitrella brassicaformis CCMP3155]